MRNNIHYITDDEPTCRDHDQQDGISHGTPLNEHNKQVRGSILIECIEHMYGTVGK